MAAKAEEWYFAGKDLPYEGDDRSEWELLNPPPPLEPEPDWYDPPARCDNCIPFPGQWSDCCCHRCRSAPRLPGEIPLCADCMTEVFCRICGLAPKHSSGRCDTCRKYYERTGRERPVSLARKRAHWLSLSESDDQDRISRRGYIDPFR
jgi:hypothetical protein